MSYTDLEQAEGDPAMVTARWFHTWIVVLALSSISCARPIPAFDEMGFRAPVWTQDGLYLVEQDGPGALFLAPPPLRLDGYRNIIIDDISLGFRDGVRPLSAAEQERAIAMVRRHLRRRLSSEGWQLVEGAAPATLRMRVAISGIDYPRGELRGFNVVGPGGAAHVTVELRDSTDNRRLLIYAQNRKLPAGVYSGPAHFESQRIADVFIEYSFDLWDYVQSASREEFPGPRKHAKRQSDSSNPPDSPKE